MTMPDLTRTLVRELDALAYDQVARAYGIPDKVDTRYLEVPSPRWRPGMGHPVVAPDGPAEAQAIGRCVSARTVMGVKAFDSASIHAGECGWCDYPIEELLAALAYAVWIAQCVDVEIAVWRDEGGRTYQRSTGRSGQYDNPTWSLFFRGVASDQDAAPSDLARWRMLRREDTDRAASREAVS